MTYNITVDIKNVYGNTLVYPVCFNAKKFTDLTKNNFNQWLGYDCIEFYY